MDKKRVYFCSVLFLISCMVPIAVAGSAKTYNMHAVDVTSLLYLNLNVSFTDNGTETTDNETVAGQLDFTVFDRSFDSSDGTYVQTGTFFTGSWSAVERKYSAYYETTLNTFFNYSIYGLFFFDDFLTSGVFYGEQVTKIADGKTLEQLFFIGPFIGVMVSFTE